VVVKSTSSTSPPWALIVVSVALAALGALLLGLAARRKQANATATAAPKTPAASQSREG
jgi:hypothetical protein